MTEIPPTAPQTFARIAAHRGLHTDAVENSIPSAQAALTAGADMVEMDARPTRDDQLVIHHGAWEGWHRIDATRESRLPLLEDGRTAMPTFDGMLDTIAGRAGAEVHIKRGADAVQVVDQLAAHDALEGSMLLSFFPGQIRAAKEHAPQARTALLVWEPGPVRWLRERIAPDLEFIRAKRAGANAIAPSRSMVTPAFLEGAARHGLTVVPWSVNDPAEMARLLPDPRVETMITDRTDLAVSVRDALAGQQLT